MRDGAFAAPDEPLDADGATRAAAFASGGMSAGRIMTSPARAARETAGQGGCEAVSDPRLRDMDYGAWAGLTFGEVMTRDADKFAAWLADPAAGTPQGESMADVQARAAAWLAEHMGQTDRLIAITHPMVIRALLTVTVDIPVQSVLRFDIAPLSATILSHNRLWRLQSLGR